MQNANVDNKISLDRLDRSVYNTHKPTHTHIYTNVELLTCISLCGNKSFKKCQRQKKAQKTAEKSEKHKE